MAGLSHLYQHQSFVLHVFLLLISFLLIIHPYESHSDHLPAAANPTTLKEQQPPNSRRFFKGVFAFGSSTVDNGNNNYLETRAKVNYTPYGFDFPLHASTGRFSDGDNIVDHVCRRLNLPLIKPFLDPSNTGQEMIHGVNYGSGAAGILNSTGTTTGQVISWSQQVNNFEKVTLVKLVGKPAGDQHLLSRYLFFLVPSGNDYRSNYIGAGTSGNLTIERLTSNLIRHFSIQIERLYQSGARNFLIVNMFPIGYTPLINRTSKARIMILNAATQHFNTRLKPLLDDIKRQREGFEFVLVDSYKIIEDIIKNPSLVGFTNVDKACCELDGIAVFCKRGGTVCPDRSKYAFFDSYHLSTAASNVIVSKAYTSTLRTEVYPINLQQLEQRQSPSHIY